MTTLTKKDEAESVGPSGAPAAQTPEEMTAEQWVWNAEVLCTHTGPTQACVDCMASVIRTIGQRRDAAWQEALRAYGIQLSPRGWIVVETPGHDHAPLRALLRAQASASEGGPHGK